MDKPAKMGRPPKDAAGSRSSNLTIRVTPKMRFGLEMMSRLYHESIPDIVERAVRDAFNGGYQGLSDYEGDAVEANGYRNLLKVLWNGRPSDRIANIALHCKRLLAAHEIRLWDLVKSKPEFWADPAEFTEKSLRRDVLAKQWEALQEEFAQQGM